jgi:phosphoserine phosphatase
MATFTQFTGAQIIEHLTTQAPKDAVFVFDCDGTLISGDIASHTAWGLVSQGLANPEEIPSYWTAIQKKPFTYQDFRDLREHISDKKGANGVYEWEAKLQAGCDPKTVLLVAQDHLERGLSQGSLHMTDILSHLAERVAAQSWIVSGSPQACVSAVAKKLGISKDKVIGTLLETVDGIFAPRILPPGVIWEKLKRLALEENGIYQPWLVAGDSIGDWHMMQIATDYVWCVIWDEHRHRGEEFRDIVQSNVLKNIATLPKEPGIYMIHVDQKHWIFEVRGDNQKPW